MEEKMDIFYITLTWERTKQDKENFFLPHSSHTLTNVNLFRHILLIIIAFSSYTNPEKTLAFRDIYAAWVVVNGAT